MSWVAVAMTVSIGLQIASTYQKWEASEDQANAVAREGAMKAKEKSKQTLRLVGQQKSSFASSGISLNGEAGSTTGYMFEDTYKTGLADVEQIKENYNTQSKSIMSNARAQLISDMGKIAMSAGSAMGGMGGAPAPEGGGMSGLGNSYGSGTPSGVTDMGSWSKTG